MQVKLAVLADYANVTGDGTTKMLIDTNAVTPQRFYRPVLNN